VSATASAQPDSSEHLLYGTGRSPCAVRQQVLSSGEVTFLDPDGREGDGKRREGVNLDDGRNAPGVQLICDELRIDLVLCDVDALHRWWCRAV
jgi:hypothetical protein